MGLYLGLDIIYVHHKPVLALRGRGGKCFCREHHHSVLKSIPDPDIPTPKSKARRGHPRPQAPPPPQLLKSSARMLPESNRPQGELVPGKDCAREGRGEECQRPPFVYPNTPLPAPPRALKSHPSFVVSPGGAGVLGAGGIKAAVAAVAAQSSVRPAAWTVGPLEAPGARTCSRTSTSSSSTASWGPGLAK